MLWVAILGKPQMIKAVPFCKKQRFYGISHSHMSAVGSPGTQNGVSPAG